MMTNSQSMQRQDHLHHGEQYLEAMVRAATPARLRLMLIERAIEVAAFLADAWRDSDRSPDTHDASTPGVNEHSLRLLDLLNELLSGVVGGKTENENAICSQVADLYVFLAKHLVAAEQANDAQAIDEIRLVLEVEAETWRAVCAQEAPPERTRGSGETTTVSGGLNLEA